ncbi:MAG: hypothetical protein D6761_09895, partial [Candidatus Dadabacteria bacterium]
MLREIHIENLAVIERLTVELPAGFVVLTGETGAGKSLVIQALELVAGARATADLIRAGADEALIEARVALASDDARRRLAEQGYGDEGDVIVRRILRADGGHRVYVNGRMATAGLLQEVIGPEVEIHAQHSQQRLLDGAVQRDLLDRYGEHGKLLEQVGQAWSEWQRLVERLDDLRARGAGREQEIDYLRFQIQELQDLAPQPGEAAELRERVRRTREQLRTAEAVASVREWLTDADDSALDRIYSAAQALSGAGSSLAALAARADELAEALRDLVRELPRADTSDLEEIDAAEARVARYDRLARKHGVEADELADWLENAEQRLADLEAWDERIVELERDVERARQQWEQAAQALSAARQEAAARLASAVT